MRVWSFADGRWQPGELPDAEQHWFDLDGRDHDELRRLAGVYGLHPLAVQDCISPYLHTPKIDDFGTHVFIILLAMAPGTVEVALEELDVFLGQAFLITYRDSSEPAPALEEVVALLERGVGLRPGTDGLLYEIADRAVDAMFPRVSAMSEQLDRIEDAIVESGVPGQYTHRILELRREAGKIRRLLAPQLAVVLRFGRAEMALVQSSNVIYFRDVYDHLLRVDLALEELREDAEVALNTYLSTLNNRMNEVMKVLAVVGALALPSTVITGVFGTNFDDIPGLHSNWGFGAMVMAMATLAGSMAYFFHRRGWF
jgi:magnesium transporter